MSELSDECTCQSKQTWETSAQVYEIWFHLKTSGTNPWQFIVKQAIPSALKQPQWETKSTSGN